MITGKNESKILTLFRMDFFGAAYGWEAPLPKICHTYSTMMKHGTVIPKEGPKTI